MKRERLGTIGVVLAAALVLSGAALAAAGKAAPPKFDKEAVDKALAALPKYDWGQSQEALNAIDDAIVASHGNAAVRKDLEGRLSAILGQADATRAAKQYVCRKLSLIGTGACVPAVEPLLTDNDLSHMARYALERIPDPAAGKAIRDAIGKVSGRIKVGVINSVGAREDKEATAALTPLLRDPDAEVAAAAAAALGKIGTTEAASALAEFRAAAPKALQAAAADASLDAAQRLIRDGKRDEAAKIYEALDKPEQPARVRIAAFQGMVAARPAEAAPRLLKALAGDDAELRGLAGRLVKEAGKEATKIFAENLPKLPPPAQAVLLNALGECGDAEARPAVVEAAKSQDPAVRTAAIQALGSLGTGADVAMLAATAAADKPGESDAARASLARLGGKEVNQTIVAALGSADPKVQVELLKALGGRAAAEAAPAVAKCLESQVDAVRSAAADALGALADENQISPLVKLLKAAKADAERAAVEKAIQAVCTRIRDKATPGVIAGMEGADAAAKGILLGALSRCGGAKALEAVLAATKDAAAEIKDAAIRSLTNWPDQAACPALLDLAGSAADKTHQVLAVRGVVRLVRASQDPADQKVKMLAKVMPLAAGANEKRQVLAALGDAKTAESLKLIAAHLDEAGLAEEASAAAVSVARDLAGNADLVRATLEKVVSVSKNKRTLDEAKKLLAGRAPRK